MAVKELYIGGGILYGAKFNGTDYDTEVEIGHLESANLKIDTEEVDVDSKDTGVKKRVAKFVTAITSNLTFTTKNVNKENMAIAMLGTETTETFAIGATLPDNTIATVETTLPVIIGGANPIVEMKLRFVATNIAGDFNPVLLIHHAYVKASGDVRDYFADKASTLDFDAEVVETNGEYFKEYSIPKA